MKFFLSVNLLIFNVFCLFSQTDTIDVTHERYGDIYKYSSIQASCAVDGKLFVFAFKNWDWQGDDLVDVIVYKMDDNLKVEDSLILEKNVKWPEMLQCFEMKLNSGNQLIMGLGRIMDSSTPASVLTLDTNLSILNRSDYYTSLSQGNLVPYSITPLGAEKILTGFVFDAGIYPWFVVIDSQNNAVIEKVFWNLDFRIGVGVFGLYDKWILTFENGGGVNPDASFAVLNQKFEVDTIRFSDDDPDTLRAYSNYLKILKGSGQNGGWYALGNLDYSIGIAKYDTTWAIKKMEYFPRGPSLDTSYHLRPWMVDYSSLDSIYVVTVKNFNHELTGLSSDELEQYITVYNLDTNLRQNWKTVIGNGEYWRPSTVNVTKDGGAIITALKFSWKSNPDFHGQYVILKLGKSGNVISEREFGRTGVGNIVNFPNPIEDKLYLQGLPENVDFIYRIESLSGSTVSEGVLTQPSLNMSNFRKGTYILYLLNSENGFCSATKIIKQ